MTIEAFADTGNCCFINVDVVVFICFSINVLLDVGDCFFHLLLLFRVEAGVIRKGQTSASCATMTSTASCFVHGEESGCWMSRRFMFVMSE